MANRAVVLTDYNSYLASRFEDEREVAFYSLKDLSTLSAKAERLIADTCLREGIAERAYREFEEHQTWICRAKAILAMAEGLK